MSPGYSAVCRSIGVGRLTQSLRDPSNAPHRPPTKRARPSVAEPLSIGGANRDRTGDLYNAIVALSQLSYGPMKQRPRWRRAGEKLATPGCGSKGKIAPPSAAQGSSSSTFSMTSAMSSSSSPSSEASSINSTSSSFSLSGTPSSSSSAGSASVSTSASISSAPTGSSSFSTGGAGRDRRDFKKASGSNGVEHFGQTIGSRVIS